MHTIPPDRVERAAARFENWSVFQRAQAMGVYKEEQPELGAFAVRNEKQLSGSDSYGNGTIVWGAFFAFMVFRDELGGPTKRVTESILKSISQAREEFEAKCEEESEFVASDLLQNDFRTHPQLHLYAFMLSTASRREIEANLLAETIVAARKVLDVVVRALDAAERRKPETS